MSKFNEDKQEEKEKDPTPDLSQLLMLGDVDPEPAKLRLIGLYGEVTEDNAAETTYSLMALKELGKKETPSDPDDPDSDIVITYEPLDFVFDI